MKPDISAWGEAPPHFINLLADLVEQMGTKEAAARRLGVSRTTVSTLLSNKYPNKNMRRMEMRVLDVLGNVNCPVLGSITAAECQKNRNAKFTPSNPQRVQLFRACKTCPNNTGCTNSNPEA